MNSETARPAVHRRSRVPVALAGIMLIWCAAWYCRGGDTVLVWTTLVVSIVAVIPSRPLRSTTRAAVWTSLAAVFLCLAANVSRVTPPPPGAEMTWYQYDRVATIGFALALAALFFRPSSGVVTTACTAGGMPMVMLTIVRDHGRMTERYDILIVWGFLGLAAVLEQVQRLMRPPRAGRVPVSSTEVLARFAAMAVALATAVLLREPVEAAAVKARESVFGMLNVSHRTGKTRRGGGDLLVGSPFPGGGRAMRPLLSICSGTAPGYLREACYADYFRGSWRAMAPGERLSPTNLPARDPWHGTYAAFVLQSGPVAPGLFEYHILQPGAIGGFCLPGSAALLGVDEDEPRIDSNGVVRAVEALPRQFAVRLLADPRQAWTLPRDAPGPAYTNVPAFLQADVRQWVSDCEGLAGATSAVTAAHAIVRDFAHRFTYDLSFRSHGEPLLDFMRVRHGHCTLYASATALMLRERGIPTRVVGGFLCTDQNPITGEWAVRERDAHSWVEAWDGDARGWFLVEATPPAGLPTAFGRPGAARLIAESLTVFWRRFTALVATINVIGVLAGGGAWIFGFLQHWLANSFGLALLLTGALLWVRHRLRRRRPPAERLRLELEAGMARIGARQLPAELRRVPNESWSSWTRRVSAVLPAEEGRRLAELTDAYQAVRYRLTLDAAAAAAWLRRSRTWRLRG